MEEIHIYWKHGRTFNPYSMVEIDSNFYARDYFIIGPLAKIIRASNSFKQ